MHLHCSVPRPTIADPPPCPPSPLVASVAPPPTRIAAYLRLAATCWGIFCISILRFESIFLGVFPVGLGFVLLCFLTFWCRWTSHNGWFNGCWHEILDAWGVQVLWTGGVAFWVNETLHLLVVSVDGGWNTRRSANGDGGVFQWGSHIFLACVLAGFSHFRIIFFNF